jgi:DNA-directed RNA polymerase specialized sigma24 family protein
LKDALEQLEPVDKSIVVLSDLEGMSNKEIGLTVGSTVSAHQGKASPGSAFFAR